MIIPTLSCNIMLQPPKWMSMEELILPNFFVDVNYDPFHGNNLQPVTGSESTVSYFERSIDFLNTILIKDKTKIICISDTTSMREELDSCSPRITYCLSAVMEKHLENVDDNSWKLGKAIKIMTYLNQSTKLDYRFLLKERNDL